MNPQSKPSRGTEAEPAKGSAFLAAQLDHELQRPGFISALGHELRTPLNVILGNAALLQEQNPREAQGESLRDIELSGQLLLALVNDLVDLARLDSGLVELSLQPAKIQDFCDASLRTAQDLAKRKGLVLTSEYRHSSPEVNLDGRRFRQVVGNLLRHAIKWAATGSRLQLETTETAVPATLHVTVRGLGGAAGRIAPRSPQPHGALSPDPAAHRSERIMEEGLALVVARKLVELHGGELSLQISAETVLALDVWFPIAAPQNPVAGETGIQGLAPPLPAAQTGS